MTAGDLRVSIIPVPGRHYGGGRRFRAAAAEGGPPWQEDGWTKLNRAEQQQAMAAYTAYTEALARSGALKGVGRLEPSSTATTVRIENGRSVVLDGPYVDSKEQIGGYYLIDVDDLDAAIAWAARCPAAGHGVIEVRPLRPR
jgi:hypothetical protein